MAIIFSTPMRTACSTASAFRYRSPVIDIRIVSTPFALKPGSTLLRATKVRTSSAEPTSRTSASATSATTSTDRVLFCWKPVPARLLLSFNVA